MRTGLMITALVLAAASTMACTAPAPVKSADSGGAVSSVPSAATEAPTAPPAPSIAALPDLGPAPEFQGLGPWVNSEPLTLAALRGKVVLVDFWTLGCYNCRNTLPYVTSWYEKYKSQGFVVIGVHTPEFAYERETENVQAAVTQHGIDYPVAQDNEYDTWNAFSNHYWPAAYFVDARGQIRHVQIGEGGYQRAEDVIQQLLAEATVRG